MESYEYEDQSQIAETLLREVAKQREEPMGLVFRKAATYCREVFVAWRYEQGQRNRLAGKEKELVAEVERLKRSEEAWKKAVEYWENEARRLEAKCKEFKDAEATKALRRKQNAVAS